MMLPRCARFSHRQSHIHTHNTTKHAILNTQKYIEIEKEAKQMYLSTNTFFTIITLYSMIMLLNSLDSMRTQTITGTKLVACLIWGKYLGKEEKRAN